MNFSTLFLALLEGFGLIISPCILPVLPIILGSSITGGRSKPFGVIVGFIISFVLFAIASRKISQVIGLDLNIVRNVSFGLLILFSLTMIFSSLEEKFSGLMSKFSSKFQAVNPQSSNKFISGIFIGSLVGIVWTPCAGPILAIVIIQTIQAQTDFLAILILLFFSIGAALPMLLISIFGRKIMNKFKFFVSHSSMIKKILGSVILVLALLGIFGVNIGALASFSLNKSSTNQSNMLENSYQAPEISGITNWINSTPLTIESLKGKVVLVDFWAYSCINCIRTLPHIREWYAKYHDKGLVIIGIHAPEFEFEKSLSNVQNAVKSSEIKYPVALDNNFITWKNYKNQYWPAHYLINKTGKVVYTHFGEGNYDVTENNIRELLDLPKLNDNAVQEQPQYAPQSLETYLGSNRAENNVNQSRKNFVFPSFIPLNSWALEGSWKVDREFIESGTSGDALRFNFISKKVFLVMSNAYDPTGSNSQTPIKVAVSINGKHVNDIEVSFSKLYKLVDLQKSENAMLEIKADKAGLRAYAFTFGS